MNFKFDMVKIEEVMMDPGAANTKIHDDRESAIVEATAVPPTLEAVVVQTMARNEGDGDEKDSDFTTCPCGRNCFDNCCGDEDNDPTTSRQCVPSNIVRMMGWEHASACERCVDCMFVLFFGTWLFPLMGLLFVARACVDCACCERTFCGSLKWQLSGNGWDGGSSGGGNNHHMDDGGYSGGGCDDGHYGGCDGG